MPVLRQIRQMFSGLESEPSEPHLERSPTVLHFPGIWAQSTDIGLVGKRPRHQQWHARPSKVPLHSVLHLASSAEPEELV